MTTKDTKHTTKKTGNWYDGTVAAPATDYRLIDYRLSPNER